MNEIANATANGISMIEQLAMQARMLRANINVSMWQLARVFIEAKKLVDHGQWENWLRDNADCSVRTAQEMMAAYKRFGDNPQLTALGQTKAFKLLPLPEGTEEEFLREHDVENMSTREIQEAVKQARAEAEEQAEARITKMREEMAEKEEAGRKAWSQQVAEERQRLLDETRQRIEEAKRRAEEAMNRPPEVPQEMVAELEAAKEKAEKAEKEIYRLAELGNTSMAESRRLAAENSRLQMENREQAEMLEEQQEALNQAQAELLNLQSAKARGEEHHYTDDLTLDVFEGAVREFIGVCARMPHMGATFSTMDNTTLNRYFQLVKTVESWVDGARNAIATVNVGGGIIID